MGIAKLAGVVLTGSLAGGLAAVALATNAWSAEYEVRMPVEKTVRIAPIGETDDQAKAAAEKAATEKAAKQADKAPKTALGKAAEAAAAQEKAQEKAQAKAKTPEPAPEKAAKEAYAKAAKTAAPEKAKPKAKPAAKKNVKPALAISADPDGQEPKDLQAAPSAAVQEPQAEPAPKAAKTAKSAKAAPTLDPKGAVLPAAPATTGPIALPADGLWVGELSVRYEAHRVILHAASSKAVEHVTWFNQAEPRKLALDLRGEWRKKGAHVLRVDSGPVKNIIVGDHPDRLRLAVEFRDGVVPASVDPKVETAPDGVTIIIPLAVELKP